jgi:hypothetical protein
MSSSARALGRRARARVTASLAALVRYSQPQPMAPAEWLVPGLPLPLLVPVLIALPCALSAALRAVLAWSLPATMPLALLLSLPPFAFAYVAWRRRTVNPSRASYAVPLAVAVASVVALYRRDFAGLTNYVGADAGVHVYQYEMFIRDQPGVYIGFVAMYGVMFWLQKLLGCNVYWALCIAYYFAIAVTAAIPCIVALAQLGARRRTAARVVGIVTCAVSATLLAALIVLPQQHYNETDGFIAHLFALIPLLLIWLADSVTNLRIARWSALLIGVVMYRYTYGLNLADLSLSVGAVLFMDSFGGGIRWPIRWLLRMAPLPFAWAAVAYLRMLRPQIASYGWILQFDLPTILWALGYAAGGLCVVAILAVATASDKRLLARSLRLPIVFALSSTAVAYLGWHLPGRQPYYVLKYPMQAVVLCAGAIVVALTALVANAVDGVRGGRWLWAGAGAVALCAYVAAVQGWLRGYEKLWPMYLERVAGHAPYKLNRPLADLAAWQRIQRVLENQQKQFGGYVTTWWPMFNFMNAGLGYYNGGRVFWDHGGVHRGRGYCVFWDHGPVDASSTPFDLSPPLRDEVSRLESADGKTCTTYRAYWDHAIARTLCHVCE